MKKVKDFFGRNKKQLRILMKEVDGIKVYHFPNSKVIRYVICHDNPRIEEVCTSYGQVDTLVDNIRNSLRDAMVEKLSLETTPKIEFKTRKLNAKWTLEPIEELRTLLTLPK